MQKDVVNLPFHQDLEEILFQYRRLIGWLKDMDPRKFTELQMVLVEFRVGWLIFLMDRFTLN
jgi:hypothetical protein